MTMDSFTINRNTPSNVRKTLNNDVNEIKSLLKEIQSKVRSDVNEWWKGESSKRFTTGFDEVKKQAEGEINVWFEGHINLVNEIVNRKIQQEQSAGAV